jgi:predicted nucleotidyltransferase
MLDHHQIYERLKITPSQLDLFCYHHAIHEFSVFGSVLRDDFRPDSDVDVLVVFESETQKTMSLLDFVGIRFELEDLLHRRVDLLEKESVLNSSNWIRRDHILSTMQVINVPGQVMFA